MIFRLSEHDGCFGIEMDAETLADAALLARFALNVTKKVRSLSAVARKDGTFDACVVFGKRRRDSGEIKS